MRLTAFSRAALLALAVVAGACSDSTSPARKTSLSIDFCNAAVPDWFAIQNQGEDWQAVAPNATGTFTFDGTSKLSIAFTFADPSEIHTQIFNITAAELEDISGVACDVVPGSKDLTGTVVGLTGQQVARVSMGGSIAGVQPGQTAFILADVPSGPRDLMATRFTSAFSSPADRIIVRRDLDLSDGGAIPVLNFSTEGQQLTGSIVTFSNLGGDLASVSTTVQTANGTTHTLGQLTLSWGGNAVAYYSVPAALQRATDLHTLSVAASGFTGVRTVTQYYRTPTNQTIALGPQLNTPTVTTIASLPYLRLGATIASQTEYDNAVEVDFSQFIDQVSRVVYVVTTRGFHGATPATWELAIPDFSGTGYTDAWGLRGGSAFLWVAHGYKGSAGDLLALTTPAEGLTLTSATRSSTQ